MRVNTGCECEWESWGRAKVGGAMRTGWVHTPRGMCLYTANAHTNGTTLLD